MKPVITAVILTASTLLSSSVALATTIVVYPGEQSWTASAASITGANPRSGSGSYELTENALVVGATGGPFGTYGQLESISFDWYVQSFSDPHTPPPPITAAPDVALRLYNFGDPNGILLHWDSCPGGTPCAPVATGSWQTTTLTRAQLSAIADGINPVPSTIPNDTPITEINLFGSKSYDSWHGYLDNVTLKFAGQDAVTYNFEVHAVPEPGTWALMAVGLLGALTLRRPQRLAVAKAR